MSIFMLEILFSKRMKSSKDGHKRDETLKAESASPKAESSDPEHANSLCWPAA